LGSVSSLERLKLGLSGVGYIKLSLGMTNYPQQGRGQGYVTHF